MSIAKTFSKSIPGISRIMLRARDRMKGISTPTPVDVSAAGMAMQNKKSKALKGTGVSYSGIKTSSQGLLVGANTEKKTLLGG